MLWRPTSSVAQFCHVVVATWLSKTMKIVAKIAAHVWHYPLTEIYGWAERRRQRQALASLIESSDHLLRDVGLTREEARREAAKPFWR